MGKPIYLDYNATTPIDHAVQEAMLPYLVEYFGNPSTTHAYGLPVKEAIERARQQVASLIGATPEEIIFTSGGSESDNHAIVGTALANSHRGKHIITMRIEHPAVLNTCRYLEERLGFKVTYVSVDKYGLVDPADIRRAITGETVLITIMHANNEVGTIEPIAEIGEIAREREILFHTDAAQSCGKVKVDVNELKVDLLTIAGHKLYAPKGIGALFIRRGVQIDSLIHGAGQENGRRAGTENVPYIVGLGTACEIARQELTEYGAKVKDLRDKLHSRIVQGLGEKSVHLNGHPERRLPNTLNISIRSIVGDELLSRMPELAASTGAACHAGS
ncbi:MAG: aminotransferase class V-fold PLP-dependent enzyme, partial [Dehalococcoidales bacterium]|nr:aminotransferase class V-fold PLP-dependent enzyme [Dehalococcoidales bacterium]